MKNFLLVVLAFLTSFTRLSAQESIPLWVNGAPGSEKRMNEPENVQGNLITNIHHPSITVFLPPKEKANGAAVLILPGGGHRKLVYGTEGVQPAEYFNNLGVAAFVLKYRLFREEGSTYTIREHGVADAERAMRLIRSRAEEWRVDPQRLGVIGFSAGGEILSLIAYKPGRGAEESPDPIDRFSSKPNFQIQIYPGGLGAPDTVPADAPPAFLLVANDDKGHVEPIMSMLNAYRKVGVDLEAHIFARGGHGFTMGKDSKLQSIQSWTQRLSDWMTDSGLLTSR